MKRLDFKVSEVTLICFCFLISLNLASSAEVQQRTIERSPKRAVNDPVSDFFSELGDLILDIDRSLTVQTAPKVEYEDSLVAQVLRPSNEYFRNARNNYLTLQKRLGTLIRKSLAPKGSYGERDVSTVSATNLAEKMTETSTLASDALHKKSGSIKVVEDGKISSESLTQTAKNLKSECSFEMLNNPFIDFSTRQKCSQMLGRPMEQSSEETIILSKLQDDFLTPLDSKLLDSLKYDFRRRGGDVAKSDSKPEGRVIGEVLHSESLFDKRIRKLLKDHGKWLLDNPLLTRWRKSPEANAKDEATTEVSTTETEVTTSSSEDDLISTHAYVPTTIEYQTELSNREKPFPGVHPSKRSNYYRINDDKDSSEEEIEIVLNPLSNLGTNGVVAEVKKSQEKESVILAFTPDGVPLKLRMGPEIENPVKFLHKALKSAGVSLNVPVESYNDIEPVGKEVMKFGTGVLTRAVYLDLSNADELKSLLKTLMTSKVQGRFKL